MSTSKSSSVERTRRYRARLAEKGFANISVAVDSKTAAMLRGIASEHGRSMADVLMLGVLLARRALAETTNAPAEQADASLASPESVIGDVTDDAGACTAEPANACTSEPPKADGPPPAESVEALAVSPKIKPEATDADADDIRIAQAAQVARAAETAEAATAE